MRTPFAESPLGARETRASAAPRKAQRRQTGHPRRAWSRPLRVARASRRSRARRARTRPALLERSRQACPGDTRRRLLGPGTTAPEPFVLSTAGRRTGLRAQERGASRLAPGRPTSSGRGKGGPREGGSSIFQNEIVVRQPFMVCNCAQTCLGLLRARSLLRGPPR